MEIGLEMEESFVSPPPRVIESLIGSILTLSKGRSSLALLSTRWFEWRRRRRRLEPRASRGPLFSFSFSFSFSFFAKCSICGALCLLRPAGDIRHRLAAAQLSQPLPRNPGQIPFRYSPLFIPRNFATFLLLLHLIVHAGFPLFDYY